MRRRSAYLIGAVLMVFAVGPLWAQDDPNIGAQFAFKDGKSSGCPGDFVRLQVTVSLDLDGSGLPVQGWTYSVCLDPGLTILGGDAWQAFAHYDDSFLFTDYKYIYFPGATNPFFDDIEQQLLDEGAHPKCAAASKVCGLFETFKEIDPDALQPTDPPETDDQGRDVFVDPASGDKVVKLLPVQPDDLKLVLGPEAAFYIVPCAEAPADPGCRPPNPRVGLPAFFSIYTITDDPPTMQRGLVLDVTKPPMNARNDILDADMPVRLDGAEGTYQVKFCGPNVDGTPGILEWLATAVDDGNIVNRGPLVENLGSAQVEILSAPTPSYSLSAASGTLRPDCNQGGVGQTTISVSMRETIGAGACGTASASDITGAAFTIDSLPAGVKVVDAMSPLAGASFSTKNLNGGADIALTFNAVDALNKDVEIVRLTLSADTAVYADCDGSTDVDDGPIGFAGTGTVTADGADADAATSDGALDVTCRKCTVVTAFLRGDANNDCRVDIADGVFIINWRFRGGPDAACAIAKDADGMGERGDITDAVYIFRYRLQRGPKPPEPFGMNAGTACDVVDGQEEADCAESCCADRL